MYPIGQILVFPTNIGLQVVHILASIINCLSVANSVPSKIWASVNLPKGIA